ncbi:MAG: TRAP transporter small permease subunit, partial [Gammaproteobacteria bacterium]
MVNRDGKRGPLAAAAQVSMLASAVVIAGLVAAINLDIGGRALFDRPLRGVTEVASLAIPVMVFLALPGLVIDDALIRAGVLSRWLARGGRRFAAGLGASFRVVELVLLAAVLAATGPWLLRAWRDDEFIGVAGDFTAPLWPAKLAIVLGGGLAWLATLGALGRAVRTVGPRPAAWLPLL